jgi:ribosomal protein S18 acetylase RimI-like enzyme
VKLDLPAPLSLRVAGAADGEFLQAVYTSTRWEELSITGWDDAQKHAFLEMQFRAQDTHYRAHYPRAQFFILLEDTTAVGRLYLDDHPEELRVMDIALLTEHRSRGVGRATMHAILKRASHAGQMVTLHVEHQNQARIWYERLGFKAVEDRGVYLFMEWRSEPTQEAIPLS